MILQDFFENFPYSPPYSKRMVGRIMPKENKGIGVSTCRIYDMKEPYETALLDANGAHPVERYMSLIDAKKGHIKWVKESQVITEVLRLGSEDGLVRDEIITLERVI